MCIVEAENRCENVPAETKTRVLRAPHIQLDQGEDEDAWMEERKIGAD